MELQLKIVGFLLVLLAMLHLVFPKYFKWDKELNNLSLINKEMMYVHTFFIGLIVLLMGLLCLSSSGEMVGTKLGKNIALGLFVFWGTRLLIQFLGYSSSNWKGKKFETSAHIFFTLLWIYFSAVFFWVYLGNTNV
jgi:hypothetical protein